MNSKLDWHVCFCVSSEAMGIENQRESVVFLDLRRHPGEGALLRRVVVAAGKEQGPKRRAPEGGGA
jgi:hypothetical protein